MHTWDQGLLDEERRAFVKRNLGTVTLVEDMSWGQVDTAVLRVRANGDEFVVKTAGPLNHHIGREITAHESFTAPLVHDGRAAELIAADRAINILITVYQPGVLADETAHEFQPEIHAQAGNALRAFHDQATRVDTDYEQRMNAKSIAWLDGSHRIDPDIEAQARELLASHKSAPVTVVPTHGDWQPRNWLVHEGHLRVIDFGRFDFRPASTDLCRLTVQQWAKSPELERVFLDAYGGDPRDERNWNLDLLREAIGTAAWAYQVGDHSFEAQGHQMLVAAIARF